MRTAVPMLKLGYIICVLVPFFFFFFFTSFVCFFFTFQHVQSFQQHHIFTNKTDDDDLVCNCCTPAEEYSVSNGKNLDASAEKAIIYTKYIYLYRILPCQKCKWFWNQPHILLKNFSHGPSNKRWDSFGKTQRIALEIVLEFF